MDDKQKALLASLLNPQHHRIQEKLAKYEGEAAMISQTGCVISSPDNIKKIEQVILSFPEFQKLNPEVRERVAHATTTLLLDGMLCLLQHVEMDQDGPLKDMVREVSEQLKDKLFPQEPPEHDPNLN